MSINNVTLMGRITRDPEIRKTNNDLSVAGFSVALDRPSSGGEKQTDFINCTAWRGTADFIGKYFHKGDMIALTGSIQSRNYTDKDGNKRTAVEVVANNVSFCGGKSTASENVPVADAVEVSDEELPFD